MSDQELRELERAASTGDPVALWKLVHALERVGERRRRLAVLGKLARAGDANALALVNRAVPRPHPRATVAQGKGVRGLARVVVHAVDPGLLASELHVYFTRGDTMGRVAISELGETRPVFVRAPKPRALVGDDIAFAGDDELVVEDGGTGDVVASAALPGSAQALFARGDRIVVTTSGPPVDELVSSTVYSVFDAAGTLLWSLDRNLARAREVLTVDALVVQWSVPGSELACHDIDTGEVRWFRNGATLIVADERGVLASLVGLRGRRIALLDARTGEILWENPWLPDDSKDVLLGPTLLARQPGSLVALDRATGDLLWQMNDVSAEAMAFTEDTAYVVARRGRRLLVLGFDARTGSSELDLGLKTAAAVEGIVPLPGRLLVATSAELLEVLP